MTLRTSFARAAFLLGLVTSVRAYGANPHFAVGTRLSPHVLVSTGQVTPSMRSPSNADKARAAALFEKSADAYGQGDFKQSIELLDEAYDLDPQPVLIYNRARASEGLGNVEDAIEAYERFLTQEPNAYDRGAIEQRVATMRRQRDERVALEKERDALREALQPTPVAERPPPIVQPRPRDVLPYVVAGIGVASLAAGTVFGALALSKRNDAGAEPVQRRAYDLNSNADGLATMSTTTFILGGVLIVVGATWWLLERRSAKNQAVPLLRAACFVPSFLPGIRGSLP